FKRRSLVKIMYCWRCWMEVAMFDEKEFAIIGKLYSKAVKSIKDNIRNCDPLTQADFRRQQYLPVLEAYRQLTGSDFTGDPGDLIHHRIAVHGPPCKSCGKPLRTPQAKLCASCGTK